MKKIYRPIRTCPYCGKSFIPLKSNKQVHCGPACKDQFNSKRRNERDASFLEHINGLKNNYNILRVFEHSRSTLLTIQQLMSMRFNFAFLPNVEEENDDYYHPFGHLRLYTVMYGITSELILINTKIK